MCVRVCVWEKEREYLKFLDDQLYISQMGQRLAWLLNLHDRIWAYFAFPRNTSEKRAIVWTFSWWKWLSKVRWTLEGNKNFSSTVVTHRCLQIKLSAHDQSIAGPMLLHPHPGWRRQYCKLLYRGGRYMQQCGRMTRNTFAHHQASARMRSKSCVCVCVCVCVSLSVHGYLCYGTSERDLPQTTADMT